jgi:hypothetical protein
VHLLGRVGSRNYNEAFAQRDTTFWTIGPHLDWRVTERFKLFLGYHYERGLADGRNQPQFEDDTSYVNHYVALGFEAKVAERLEMEFGLHFERNNWTSTIAGMNATAAREDFPGEMLFKYQALRNNLSDGGFSARHRSQSFEHEVVYNTNVSVGATYRF